ncbi:MAG: hypothetical protein HON47_04160 [Candidatus Diapherotrites archaeon]|jgi:hypothetical protein|uniref:Uncharacterized protein n=1 Tax=Candidatus Iainarchaeum sp. TaxID=3101447 RepID=A0A8T5GFS3_9ARCH|nr:hypothetical protein [Candidatus Diapherotrites archaeon]
MIEEFAAMLGMDVFALSILIIIVAVIIIAISIIVNIVVTRRSKEEEVATKVLKNIKLIAKGKLNPKEEKKEEKVIVEKEKPRNGEISMKEHLSKKFKPKIEKQLKTKINLLDFNGKGSDFHALVEVGGVRVMLVLDASGKIIDYKKK